MQRFISWERSPHALHPNAHSPRVGSPGLTARTRGVPAALIWLLVAAALVLMSVPRLGAQDTLATARSLYASAAYDEALKTLQQFSADPSLAGASLREVEEYRFLCLLALGRNGEARESIAAVITADPLYKLDENATSPRVLNAFRGVRREVLPEILNNIYNAGKAMYDEKNYTGAEPQFRKVMALSGDPDLQGRGADLQTLAKGFLDLAVSAIEAAAAPAVAATSPAPTAPTTAPPKTAAPAPAPVPTRTEIVAMQGKAGEIIPPRIIKRAMPSVPADLTRLGQLRDGEMEILIDETGKVQSAKFTRPIHPVYDGLVLTATRAWRYEPARADGVPVKFRLNLRVTIQDPNRF